MATTTLRLSLTRPIPLRILGLAIRLETLYFIQEMTPILNSLTELCNNTRDLVKRCDILLERAERTQNRALEIISDIQPLWTDTYNLCGDPACDGTCMVCADGEYLGEEEYEEKYCRRRRR